MTITQRKGLLKSALDNAADLFDFNGRNYLVASDNFSGWPEVYDCGKARVIIKDVE